VVLFFSPASSWIPSYCCLDPLFLPWACHLDRIFLPHFCSSGYLHMIECFWAGPGSREEFVYTMAGIYNGKDLHLSDHCHIHRSIQSFLSLPKSLTCRIVITGTVEHSVVWTQSWHGFPWKQFRCIYSHRLHRIVPMASHFLAFMLLSDHPQQCRTTSGCSVHAESYPSSQQNPWNRKFKVYQNLDKDSLQAFTQTPPQHSPQQSSHIQYPHLSKEFKSLSFGHPSGNRHLPKPPSHVVRNQPTGLGILNQISSFYEHSPGYTPHVSIMAFHTDFLHHTLMRLLTLQWTSHPGCLLSQGISPLEVTSLTELSCMYKILHLFLSPFSHWRKSYRWMLDVELTV
jgi:hypothetical protein